MFQKEISWWGEDCIYMQNGGKEFPWERASKREFLSVKGYCIYMQNGGKEFPWERASKREFLSVKGYCIYMHYSKKEFPWGRGSGRKFPSGGRIACTCTMGGKRFP